LGKQKSPKGKKKNLNLKTGHRRVSSTKKERWYGGRWMLGWVLGENERRTKWGDKKKRERR